MKNLIFDVDGVLLNSTQIGWESLIQAAEQSGAKVPTFKILKALWGRHFEKSLIPTLAEQLEWPLDKDAEVIERFYEISYTQKYPIQPGLANDLKRMAACCRLGIISNRDPDSLEHRLHEQGINLNIFAHIHTPEQGVQKPDPAVFSHFWNGAGFKPENTIFIGDSIEHDLAAANAHEPPIRFAAITSGLHSTGEFVRAGVKLSYIFKTVQDVFQTRYLIV